MTSSRGAALVIAVACSTIVGVRPAEGRELLERLRRLGRRKERPRPRLSWRSPASSKHVWELSREIARRPKLFAKGWDAVRDTPQAVSEKLAGRFVWVRDRAAVVERLGLPVDPWKVQQFAVRAASSAFWRPIFAELEQQSPTVRETLERFEHSDERRSTDAVSTFAQMAGPGISAVMDAVTMRALLGSHWVDYVQRTRDGRPFGLIQPFIDKAAELDRALPIRPFDSLEEYVQLVGEHLESLPPILSRDPSGYHGAQTGEDCAAPQAANALLRATGAYWQENAAAIAEAIRAQP